jgi:hypothetical protein
MHHGLFVAEKVIRHFRVLLESLPDARHIPVTENSKTTLQKSKLHSVPFDILVFEEGDKCLGAGQSFAHVRARLGFGDSSTPIFRIADDIIAAR